MNEQILFLLKDAGFHLDVHTLESQETEQNMVAMRFLIRNRVNGDDLKIKFEKAIA